MLSDAKQNGQFVGRFTRQEQWDGLKATLFMFKDEYRGEPLARHCSDILKEFILAYLLENIQKEGHVKTGVTDKLMTKYKGQINPDFKVTPALIGVIKSNVAPGAILSCWNGESLCMNHALCVWRDEQACEAKGKVFHEWAKRTVSCTCIQTVLTFVCASHRNPVAAPEKKDIIRSIEKEFNQIDIK